MSDKLDYTFEAKNRRDMVEEILEQGQRLRNAMVKSILDGDPYYIDVIEEERRSYNTARKDGNNQLKLGKRDASTCTTERTSDVEVQAQSGELAEYLRHVDSLQIIIHSLTLNQTGNRRVASSAVDAKYKLPTSFGHSYFVEYSVPERLTSSQPKSGAKVDSGLAGNLFRVCSKRLQEEEIHFKHASVHDTVSPLPTKLQDMEITFRVSCRTMKQKRTDGLGYAVFNMGVFEAAATATEHNLSCSRSLPLKGDNEAVLGDLRVTLQLGHGRTLFGKEFIEFVKEAARNVGTANEEYQQQREPLPLPSSPNIQSSDLDYPSSGRGVPSASTIKGHIRSWSEKSSPHLPRKLVCRTAEPTIEKETLISTTESESQPETNRSSALTIRENAKFVKTPTTETQNKLLLYGLIYISEAQYFRGSPVDSYLSCRAFDQAETLCSRVVYNSRAPVFNFSQRVPRFLDDRFLTSLRNDTITIDFWERCGDDDVHAGTSQLSLYQFYVAYRDPTIVDALIQKRLPVTVVDWWEPICSPVDGNPYGQLKVLVALGTEKQVHNSEVERGLKNDSPAVTYVPIVPGAGQPRGGPAFRRPDFLRRPKREAHPPAPVPHRSAVERVNVGVQSDREMEPQHNSVTPHTVLETFLAQLVESKHKSARVETATNTDSDEQRQAAVTESLSKLSEYKNVTNEQLRRTSDLLDYLNGALSVDKACHHQTGPLRALDAITESDNTFEAHVIVEGALHLPSGRRRCRTKRTRRRSGGPRPDDDGLPSTYATFETVPGTALRVTPVVWKSASPRWDYQCQVLLPSEILTNNQKRFIFKVWRKTDTESPYPNPKSDMVLGFAALDLTVLMAGLPSVQGWFNIIDFSSKCNGQIKIHVTPLEDVSKFGDVARRPVHSETANLPPSRSHADLPPVAPMVEEAQEPSELLGRALKRKFTELEEITQRLRSRLADVTNQDSDASNDEFADEFEHDINTCADEDRLQPSEPVRGGLPNVPVSVDSAYGSSYDRIDRTVVANNSCSSSLETDANLTPAKQELLRGKQRIDILLEKLSLLTRTDDPESRFSQRHSSVSLDCDSGTSTEVDNVRPNLEDVLNAEFFNRLCTTDVGSLSGIAAGNWWNPQSDSACSSSDSLLTQYNSHRQAPDGAGNSADRGSGI